MSKLYNLKLFAGSTHQELAQEMSKYLNIELGKSTSIKFPDDENYVKIDEPVRDQDIFFIQSCGKPVNDNVMETLLFLDAFKRASVHSVTVIWPYFPYARQERMTKGREAISAKVIASLLEFKGASRVIFVDIHNKAIQGFFDIPVDSLSAFKILVARLKQPQYRNCVIVSPDAGRAELAAKFAAALGLDLVVMYKRRIDAEHTETIRVVGNIKGKRPIIVDDVMASGSVLKQIDVLFEQGAVEPAVFAVTHGVLLPKAIKLIQEDPRIGELIVTNTLNIPTEKIGEKITVLSIAPLVSEVIKRIHAGTSISDLVP